MSLKFEAGYRLEFAVEAKNEFETLDILSEIFGKKIKRETRFDELAKHSGLVFVEHKFLEEELPDEIYKRILDNDKILIVKDQLAEKRAGQLLKRCLPIETQLKRLLIYVYPKIIFALDGKLDNKTKIQICNQINCMTLGKLLVLLEEDLSKRGRELLAKDNNALLTRYLGEAKDFDDFRQKLEPYISSRTVWDQVNILFKEPVDYKTIKGQLRQLEELRNKAAHPQTILKEDLESSKKTSRYILSKISNVRNDYYEDLAKSLRHMTEAMQRASEFTSKVNIAEVISDTLKEMPKIINDTMSKLEAARLNENLGEVINQIDWDIVANSARNSDPEMDEILSKFEEHGAEKAIDELSDELNNSLPNESA